MVTVQKASLTWPLADGERYPRAARIAELAVSRWQRGLGVAPEFALPAYLRDKVALTEVERGVR